MIFGAKIQIFDFGIFHEHLSNKQLTCLATLFDRKLLFSRTLAKCKRSQRC